MGALLSKLLAWFAGKNLLEIAIGAAKWLAMVALVKFVMFTALGAAAAVAVGFVLNFAQTQIMALYAETGVSASPVLQLTGLAGYLGGLLRLPECMTILVAGWSFRFLRQVVPFL